MLVSEVTAWIIQKWSFFPSIIHLTSFLAFEKYWGLYFFQDIFCINKNEVPHNLYFYINSSFPLTSKEVS